MRKSMDHVEEISLTSTIFLIFAEFVNNFDKVLWWFIGLGLHDWLFAFSAVTGQRVTASDKIPPS